MIALEIAYNTGMSLDIHLTLEDISPEEAEQIKSLSPQEIREAMIAALYGRGLITSAAGRQALGLDRREFYNMLIRHQVPISGGPETEEDMEDNRAIYRRGA